jgi:manganese/zinc/iron transport system permease protein
VLDPLVTLIAFGGGYNTAVVLLGASLLGLVGGMTGCFVLLRRRALISDAISHATLPGVAIGFLVGLWLGVEGRSLPILLAGAAISAALGALAVQWIKDHTRLAEDAAIGTVLSVFFGLGVVLLSHIQTLPTAGQAGLDSFLLGQTAGMAIGEAYLIAGLALAVTAMLLLLYRRFQVLAFDEDFAAALGWSTTRLDLILVGLALAVVVIGLQTVGLILIIALLIIPPVSARLWTDRLGRMVALAGLFGALSAYLGAGTSAIAPNLPTGGMIVMVAAAIALISLFAAPHRGLIAAMFRRAAGRRALARAHLPPGQRGAP